MRSSWNKLIIIGSFTAASFLACVGSAQASQEGASSNFAESYPGWMTNIVKGRIEQDQKKLQEGWAEEEIRNKRVEICKKEVSGLIEDLERMKKASRGKFQYEVNVNERGATYLEIKTNLDHKKQPYYEHERSTKNKEKIVICVGWSEDKPRIYVTLRDQSSCASIGGSRTVEGREAIREELFNKALALEVISPFFYLPQKEEVPPNPEKKSAPTAKPAKCDC